MDITVIGTGYVGLVTAACLAEMGHVVSCQDRDAKKIAALQHGQMPIYEPGLEEIVRQNSLAGRLTFGIDATEALRRAEFCFVAVGTPPGSHGSADVGQVLDAAEGIARLAAGPLTVVVKSTVPPGTCDRVQECIQGILRERGVGFSVGVVSNPEFLKEGMAVEDFRRPDRIVVGCSHPESAERMRRLYAPFLRNGHPLLLMDVRSAEFTKYASNVFLAARISLINELAQLSESVGADIASVRLGVGTDHRIGMAFLYAGIGYGGSCFPKDVAALRALGAAGQVPTPMVDAVDAVNEQQKLLLARRVRQIYPHLDGRKIAVWGLAFKPRTDDVRQAPALAIVEDLLQGGADVAVYDPVAMTKARASLPPHPKLHFAATHEAALRDADALLLCTEWDLFRTPNFENMRQAMRVPLILDGRNQYDPSEMRRLGFRYLCVGRPG